MKLYDLTIPIICLLGFTVVIGIAAQHWLGDDNEVEEIAEFVIEKETGLNIDLSPNSPEAAK